MNARFLNAFLIAWALGLAALSRGQEQQAGDWTVMLSAETRVDPPSITVSWPANTQTTTYEIYRKKQHDTEWTPRAEIPGSSTGFQDVDARRGETWEYKVVRKTDAGYTGYGYIYSGIDAPLIDQRGRVILVVASDIAAPLAYELRRLEQDLVGDGWDVARRDVSTTASVTEVKAVIRAAWEEDKASTRTVFLFGRVPIPYSGDITPDFHPNHKGAWPADVYYGEMDGDWTDTTVTAKGAEREVNWNVPGDGKFDQSEIPGDVELEVGRVDLRELTCFSNKIPSLSELDLLRNYLNKDHAFRHGLLRVPRRAFVLDYIGIKAGQDPVGTAYRNFSPFFGPENIGHNWFFFPHLNVEGYLWSWVGSGGSYHYAFGLGSSDDFAMSDPKVIFTMWLGSYYGDWNHESNFMRASLGASSHVLTASYSGAPHWMYHHMALGETIGYGVRLTQNNRPGGVYPPEAQGINQVHISLLGDPTLRLHPVLPPDHFTAVMEGSQANLSWAASPDENVVGYHVYRAADAAGPFQRLTTEPIGTLEFRDIPQAGAHVYMVRAVKRERSASGAYFNASQGKFATARTGSSPPATPAQPEIVVQPDTVSITWAAVAAGQKLEVQRAKNDGLFGGLAELEGESKLTDHDVAPGASYKYRARILSPDGASALSEPVTATIPKVAQARGTFVHEDDTTLGSWRNTYGNDGWNLGVYGQSRPSFFQFANLGANEVFNKFVTGLPGALETPDGNEQLTGGWWQTNTVVLDLNFTDSKVHRLAVYFHDHVRVNRRQKVELLDAVTGAILDSRVVADMNTGQYLVWDVQGRLHLRVTALEKHPALVTAFFLDTPQNLPAIWPLPGSYPGSIPVILGDAPEGSELRYTTDGTAPTSSSTLYTKPFILPGTGVVKTRAFAGESAVSGVASSSYSIGVISSGDGFFQEDAGTQGSWSPTYGNLAHYIPGASWKLPGSLEVAPNAALIYVWNDNTQEERALTKEPSSAQRVASAWYASDEFTVHVKFGDDEMHRLALYFVDWDRVGRSQQITLRDPTRAIIDQRTVSNFENGKYLVCDLKGAVTISVKKVTGLNALLNGLFIGRTPKPEPGGGLAPLLMNPAWGEGFTATLLGVGGTEFVVETSSDCKVWEPFLTDKFGPAPYLLQDSGATAGSRRFYRVRAQ